MAATDLEMDATSLAFNPDNLASYKPHKMLIAVDGELDSEDIENIKFLCHGFIKAKKLNNIDSGLEIFRELENCNKIVPKSGDFEFLEEILYRIHRLDLVKKLGHNPQHVKRKFYGEDPTNTVLSPFRNLLYRIAEDVTDEEFKTAMFLLQPRFGKGNLSKVNSTLQLFNFLEKEQELTEDNTEILEGIIRDIRRTDLMELVQRYEQATVQNPDAALPNMTFPEGGHATIPGGGQGTVPANGHVINYRAPPQPFPTQVSQEEYRLNVPSAQQLADPAISDASLYHMAFELATEKRWRVLYPELNMVDSQVSSLIQSIPEKCNQIMTVLQYWRDTIVCNRPRCSSELYEALLHVGFEEKAKKFVRNGYLPGVLLDEQNIIRQRNDFGLGVEHSHGAAVNAAAAYPIVGTQDIAAGFMPQSESSNQILVSGKMPPDERPFFMNNDRQDSGQLNNTAPERITSVQPGGHLTTPSNQNTQTVLQNPAVDHVLAERTINMIVQDPAAEDLPCYKMTSKPRGIAIIINNKNFYQEPNDRSSKEMPIRTGTEKDCEKFKSTFEKLHYDVHIHEDLTDVGMAQLMSQTGVLDHDRYDSFVCCILSHGVLGHVYGVNGKLVRIDIITSFFRAQSCPTLANKPKCFFIQACQGREKQRGLDVETDGARPLAPRAEKMITPADLEVDGREMIPDEADFLLGYATVPGYVSYRSRSQGSWYINKLCDNLEKYSHKYDLMSILVKVNEDVGKSVANMEDGRYTQIPAPVVTFRKKMYFR